MVRKYSAKADRNQPSIVKEYRRLGATVAHTHMVGGGFVDIVVGYMGINSLVEIKDPEQPPSKRRLTTDEQIWHDEWAGTVRIIETFEDVAFHLLEIEGSGTG